MVSESSVGTAVAPAAKPRHETTTRWRKTGMLNIIRV
jgi:hypothetical protein